MLEVMAPKPGNVHRLSRPPRPALPRFPGECPGDRGAARSAAIDGVGVAVERAIEATRRVVATNTNLGMVLLLAPLAAVPSGSASGRASKTSSKPRPSTTHPAVYRAIRLAQPGGMGSVPDQDIAEEPTMPLRAVMALAADRDLIARQYANGFREVLDEALPALRKVPHAGRIPRNGDCRRLLDHAVATSRFADRPQGRDEHGPRRLAAGGGGPRGGLARSTGGGRRCAGNSTTGSAIRAADSTPAPRPTWSRPPCTRPCEMGQSSYHSRASSHPTLACPCVQVSADNPDRMPRSR